MHTYIHTFIHKHIHTSICTCIHFWGGPHTCKDLWYVFVRNMSTHINTHVCPSFCLSISPPMKLFLCIQSFRVGACDSSSSLSRHECVSAFDDWGDDLDPFPEECGDLLATATELRPSNPARSIRPPTALKCHPVSILCPAASGYGLRISCQRAGPSLGKGLRIRPG